VSVALDSGGFTVDDRDRSAGDFFVRYVDADTGVKREDPGLFSRLFGAKGPPPAQQFRLHLTNQGNQTEVTVFDANGKRDTSPTAQRILDVLADKL
jgi:outer membrane protein assembly factor BamC